MRKFYNKLNLMYTFIFNILIFFVTIHSRLRKFEKNEEAHERLFYQNSGNIL